MTQIEQTQHAKEFAEYWKDKGDEKQETQRYWIELLQEVLGIENPARYIEFEKRVKLTHTSFIDAYISGTKVLIEQKGSKIDLTKPQEQSDGAILTPFGQAKRYADEQKAKIEKTAQAILNARAKYPESSLADLYDELSMPPELRKAHQENDRAVIEAYGFAKDIAESEIVAELFKMYEALTKEK